MDPGLERSICAYESFVAVAVAVADKVNDHDNDNDNDHDSCHWRGSVI
jgi:hypothetical protein